MINDGYTPKEISPLIHKFRDWAEVCTIFYAMTFIHQAEEWCNEHLINKDGELVQKCVLSWLSVMKNFTGNLL